MEASRVGFPKNKIISRGLYDKKTIQHVKHYHYNLLFDYVYALSVSHKLMTC